MKKRNETAGLYWIIPTALILMVVSLLFFISEKEIEPKDPNMEVERNPEKQIITEWTTYNDSEYNFNFRYPADWQLKEDKTRHVSVEQHYVNEIDLGIFAVEVIDNTENISLENWITKHKAINPDTMEFLGQNTLVIDGQSGICRKIIDNVAGGYLNDCFASRSENIFRFELIARASTPFKQAEYSQTLDQILISFKFNK